MVLLTAALATPQREELAPILHLFYLGLALRPAIDIPLWLRLFGTPFTMVILDFIGVTRGGVVVRRFTSRVLVFGILPCVTFLGVFFSSEACPGCPSRAVRARLTPSARRATWCGRGRRRRTERLRLITMMWFSLYCCIAP